ncbi:MAG: hypothetical protein H6672_17390 [Anaerolineaceae bacterium]|nr:hypothetical protein [Anaerolineaceae bacterium]
MTHMHNDRAAAFNRLRRLQEQMRSDIPAMMAQKAMSSFTLHREPEPEAAQQMVYVVVYPQDPFVGDPEVRQMNAVDIQPGLMNTRVFVRDSIVKPAQPDDEGNYLYWPGTSEFDQVNAFYYTTFTLRMYERYAQRSLPWSFPAPRLAVDPHVGDGANAFYSEQDRLLGFHSFHVDGTFVYAAQSADVVTHEAGHAVLDGLRDLFNESFGLGASAFHESFGDMTAVLVALHDDSLIQRLLEWTGGNLRISSFLSTLAEQMTVTLRKEEVRASHIQGHTIYLRNTLNTFHAKPFDELLAEVEHPENELSREPHNYSRLFSGAFYDILVGIYERIKEEEPDTPARVCMHRARDIAGYMLVCAVELGPVGECDFKDMAKAFMAANALLEKGKHEDVLVRVFVERGILTQEEAKTFCQYLDNLPEVHLPEVINSSLASALFLEEIQSQLNLPDAVEFVPMGAYRNAMNYAYLTYFTHRRITLVGEKFQQFNGTHIDLFGGLTLTFDETNRLRSAFFRPVTDKDIRQIEILVTDLIHKGEIAVTTAEILPPSQQNLNPTHPQALWLHTPPLTPDWPESGKPSSSAKLVKFPVMYDEIPQPLPEFGEFLKARQQE